MFRRTLPLPVLLMVVATAHGQAPAKILYDFEDPAALKSWSNLELKGSKPQPAVAIAVSTDHATSGKHSLKLTFAGGEFPTVSTAEVTQDWFDYPTFQADVTVSRPCVVGFTLLQEKSQRGDAWDPLISRWTKTAFLQAGKNTVTAKVPGANHYAVNPRWGKAVGFEIFMYHPRPGESIYVDNIRLTKDVPASAPMRTFSIYGTDWTLTAPGSAEACRTLGKTLAHLWNPPTAKSLDELEAEFRAKHEQMKKRFPRAVLAILRDGEKDYDPKDPDKVYAGWKDAYWNSHGPDSNFLDRSRNQGRRDSHEIFMRHRSPLMQVDFSSIPPGSNILSAQLVIVRINDKILDDHDPAKRPTMWVVEPCNRAWEEYEVNAFQFARDKFWKQIGGGYWDDDPDFPPTFLAFGPGRPGRHQCFEFTNAVKYWTDGKHANHGFMLHGDSVGYMVAYSREAADIRNRPAVLVSYVQK